MDIDNDDIAILLGKVLGEVYRSQKAASVSNGMSDAHIYGLLNGFEVALDAEFENIGAISKEQMEAVDEVLSDYHTGDKELNGFYDIEQALGSKGIDRDDAISIFKYLKADHRYVELIEKMDSSQSPVECRNFELEDWDR